MFTILFVCLSHTVLQLLSSFSLSAWVRCVQGNFFFHSLSPSHTKCLPYPIRSSVSIYIPRPSFSAKFSSFDIFHLLLKWNIVFLCHFPLQISLGGWVSGISILYFLFVFAVYLGHMTVRGRVVSKIRDRCQSVSGACLLKMQNSLTLRFP